MNLTGSIFPLVLLLIATVELRADEKPSVLRSLFKPLVAAGAGANQPEIVTVPPIQIVAATRTFRDVEKDQRLWWERVMVAPALARLEKRGDVAWAADARKFLDAAPSIVFAEYWQEKPLALQPIARRLVNDGCDDPAILILAALIDDKCEIDWNFAEKATIAALKTLDADPSMPAVLSFFTNALAAQAWKRGYEEKKSSQYLEKIPALISRMAADSSYLPNEEELFIRHLHLMKDTPKLTAQKILDLAPQLPFQPWVRQTIIGHSEQTLAWENSGADYEKRTERARAAFEQAWKMNRGCPIAASEMISLGSSGSSKGVTKRDWFDRATAAQCDYPAAYDNMQSAYRNEGDETLLAFAKACAATKRYDLEIPVSFTRICNDIAGRKKDWHSFYRRSDVAKVLLEVSDGLANEPTRAYEHYMRISYMAVNSWLVGDYARAAAALDLIKGPLHPDTHNKLAVHRMTEVEMREEVSIGNSPIAEDFQKANALYQQGELAEAKVRLKAMESRAQGAAAEGVYDKLLVIDVEEALARGEWVTLPVDPEFRGWLLQGGKWSCTGENTLVNHGNDGRAVILHRSRVGPNFEMFVEYSVICKPDTGKCCKRCEVIFDWSYSNIHNIASYGQDGSSPMRPRITGNYRYTLPKDTLHRLPTDNSKKFPYEKVNTMLIRSLDKKVSLTCNGIESFKDYQPENFRSGPPGSHVGIGSERWCNNNDTHISKIQVRRLAATAK